MTDRPENDNHYGMAATRTDVLSQVLTLIRLRGELVYSANLRGPWGIAFAKGAAHFHFIEHGEAWVRTPGAEPIHVKQGDMLLLPHGTGHLICDDPATPQVGIDVIIDRHFDRARSVLDYGGDGAATRVVGGLFNFEGGSLAAVMAALPIVVHIRSEAGKTPDWLDAIAHFLVKESHEVEPGSSLMISRLIDLLVIRTLRTWAANQATPSSWLGGLGEERIGRVLSAIHADPYRAWSVHELAGIAAMSRSIFAERFTARVGEAPLHYVKRWKLTLAADMLATGGLKVTQAAQRTGYTSDAAFSRAFKAHFGYAPSEARQR
ncbi:AraC family transcriptional regulator [Duganella aceris]|uniref:AraC family transcriptional regulator n=1 Tax=Duganella aceris TaxID=2703883 RepID=A0ABX0FGU3_9BURK|nr:AraC family transcriptional regulator [Duganella aceris]NGZ83730.1 AraC family transcriptional regulator [Duganella aceris]